MSVKAEFKKFILRGNVLDLAIGVVIGAAFGKIVSAVVDDLVMPVVSMIIPGGTWRDWTVSPANLKIGHLLGTLLDFLIIATVIFFVGVKLVGSLTKKDAPPAPAPPPTKTCPECLEAIAPAAKRCKFCTSLQP